MANADLYVGHFPFALGSAPVTANLGNYIWDLHGLSTNTRPAADTTPIVAGSRIAYSNCLTTFEFTVNANTT
jgi:hypothetical protein